MFKLETVETLEIELNQIKDWIKNLEAKLQALQTTRPTISEIPKEAKTLEGIHNLINKYNLNERVQLGKQLIPKELREFTVVAIIVKVLAVRDVDNNRPEKLRLEDLGYWMLLNNWNNYPNFLLKDLKGKTVILYNVSLSATKHGFQKRDGKWVLNWDGEYKIFSGDDKIAK